MKEKNKIVLKLIDDIKKQFEQNGYNISQETYEKVTKEYLDSDKSIEEIKIELYTLVNKKINDLKKEKERLKKINIEDYKEDILTIESLDKYGYPNIINSNIEILSKVDIGHNAPINVKFANKNGFYKNSANTSSSSLDKFEFIICQIGKMLNVKMAETYKVSIDNQPLGIISENVCNIHETLYMYSQIPKFLNKDSRDYLNLKKELERLGKESKTLTAKAVENKYKIPVVENPEDIKLVINSFLESIKFLKVPEEEQLNIRQDYFNMIMLDFIVNNVDRNKNNYGLIISEYGEVKFSPLFDNSTIDIPSMPKGYQQVNGFLINKNDLLNCLYENYYGDIKDITRVCLYNQDSLRNKVTSLCTNELSSGEQEWFLSKFNENINLVAEKEQNKDQSIDEHIPVSESKIVTNTENKEEEGPKLVRTKPSNNAGKINLVMILLTISLVLIIITLIILFKIS